MTVLGSMKVLSTSMTNLERAEIRRMRVQYVVNLAGLKFLFGVKVAGQTPIPADPDVLKLMFELNRIFLLWADNPDVMKKLRAFHADCTNKDKLFALIRAAANTTSLNSDKLGDSDINAVFQLTRPTLPPTY